MSENVLRARAYFPRPEASGIRAKKRNGER
jgi:hypothetical protein